MTSKKKTKSLTMRNAEKLCPICGKLFIPAALHAYKVKNRVVCTYGCVRKYEKEQAAKKALAEEKARAKKKK